MIDPIADHEARLLRLERFLFVKPRQEVARLLMPLDVQERQDETVRRLEAALREVKHA